MLLSGDMVLSEIESGGGSGLPLRELRAYDRVVEQVAEVASSLERGLDQLRTASGLGEQVQRAVLVERFDELTVRIRELFTDGGAVPAGLDNAEQSIRRLLTDPGGDTRLLLREFILLTAGIGTLERAEVSVHLILHSSVVLDGALMDRIASPHHRGVRVVIPPASLTAVSRAAHSTNNRIAERAFAARQRLEDLRAGKPGPMYLPGGVRTKVDVVMGGVGQLMDDPPADLDTVFARTVREHSMKHSTSAVVAVATGEADVLSHFQGADAFVAVFPSDANS